MAGRQNKVGLDYFELDCQMEEKVRLIQAEYGLKGFAVFVKLLQKIYGERGYYCEWTRNFYSCQKMVWIAVAYNSYEK